MHNVCQPLAAKSTVIDFKSLPENSNLLKNKHLHKEVCFKFLNIFTDNLLPHQYFRVA